MVQQINHGTAGPIRVTGEERISAFFFSVSSDLFTTDSTSSKQGIPVNYSETKGSIQRPPPSLGEHTSEVLQGLGFSPAEVAALREEGAL
jgi:crotonobetainyl-CoA:carnitine CoA-transferase CaiB-like acyl-CoA transferase